MRRVILISLTLAAIATAAVALQSMSDPIVFFDDLQWGAPTALKIKRRELILQYREPIANPPKLDHQFALLGFRYEARESWVTPGRPTAGATPARVRAVRASLRLWLPFVLFGAYPLGVFVCRPIQRARRRSRRQCHRCAYSLIGNETGVCSECGINTDTWMIPVWQRIAISLLLAVIIGWLLEYTNTILALDHRVAVWMLRHLHDESGSWMVMSTLRSMLYAGTCIAVYVYLSPERYRE